MMAIVPHVTSGFGLRKFQAVGFLLTRVYIHWFTAHSVQQLHQRLTRLSTFNYYEALFNCYYFKRHILEHNFWSHNSVKKR